MTLGHPRTGVGWGAAYAASGLPWVTGSVSLSLGEVHKLQFGNVTKFITVSNTGAGYLSIGFTTNGILGTNAYTIEPSSSQTFDLRVRDLFVSGVSVTTYDVLAGVTTISRNEFPHITGSNPAPTGSQHVPNIG